METGENELVMRVRENPFTIPGPEEFITLNRVTDLTGMLVALAGYTFGDSNAMLAGMALYQANTGNRA